MPSNRILEMGCKSAYIESRVDIRKGKFILNFTASVKNKVECNLSITTNELSVYMMDSVMVPVVAQKDNNNINMFFGYTEDPFNEFSFYSKDGVFDQYEGELRRTKVLRSMLFSALYPTYVDVTRQNHGIDICGLRNKASIRTSSDDIEVVLKSIRVLGTLSEVVEKKHETIVIYPNELGMWSISPDGFYLSYSWNALESADILVESKNINMIYKKLRYSINGYLFRAFPIKHVDIDINGRIGERMIVVDPNDPDQTHWALIRPHFGLDARTKSLIASKVEEGNWFAVHRAEDNIKAYIYLTRKNSLYTHDVGEDTGAEITVGHEGRINNYSIYSDLSF